MRNTKYPQVEVAEKHNFDQRLRIILVEKFRLCSRPNRTMKASTLLFGIDDPWVNETQANKYHMHSVSSSIHGQMIIPCSF